MCEPYQLLALKKLNIDIPEATILVKIHGRSCEIKGINCISKPKFIFHKYANSVNNMYMLWRPNEAKEEREKRETNINSDPQRKHSS